MASMEEKSMITYSSDDDMDSCEANWFHDYKTADMMLLTSQIVLPTNEYIPKIYVTVEKSLEYK